MTDSQITQGSKVPSTSFESNKGSIDLSQYKGTRVVLYFYPRDNTPGCTTESKEFAEHYQEFKDLNTEIIGVSCDSLASHEKFAAKHELPFALIADTDESLCRLFDVIKEKNMYGKKVMGIERSTFVIDEEGTVIQEWRKVRVPSHVENVLNFIKSL